MAAVSRSLGSQGFAGASVVSRSFVRVLHFSLFLMARNCGRPVSPSKRARGERTADDNGPRFSHAGRMQRAHPSRRRPMMMMHSGYEGVARFRWPGNHRDDDPRSPAMGTDDPFFSTRSAQCCRYHSPTDFRLGFFGSSDAPDRNASGYLRHASQHLRQQVHSFLCSLSIKSGRSVFFVWPREQTCIIKKSAIRGGHALSLYLSLSDAAIDFSFILSERCTMSVRACVCV